jgi:hypothetical protein
MRRGRKDYGTLMRVEVWRKDGGGEKEEIRDAGIFCSRGVKGASWNLEKKLKMRNTMENGKYIRNTYEKWEMGNTNEILGKLGIYE